MEQKVWGLSSGLVARLTESGEGTVTVAVTVAVIGSARSYLSGDWFCYWVGERLLLCFFMIERFDVFVVAKEFYEKCKCLKLPQYLTDQLLRASSSIALNVAEGSGKRTLEDQRRFYTIAFGSLRECQAILLIENVNDEKLIKLADRLGAMLFKLSKKQPKR